MKDEEKSSLKAEEMDLTSRTEVLDFTSSFKKYLGTPPRSVQNRLKAQTEVSAPSPLSEKQRLLLEKYSKGGSGLNSIKSNSYNSSVSFRDGDLNEILNKIKLVLKVDDEKEIVPQLIKSITRIKTLSKENENLMKSIEKLKLRTKLNNQDVECVEKRKKEVENRYLKDKEHFKIWTREKEVEISKLKNQMKLKENKIGKLETDLFKLRQTFQKTGSKGTSYSLEKYKKDNLKLKKRNEVLVKEIGQLKAQKVERRESDDTVVIKNSTE
eukprot:snap_masked-scaffold_8-processed-gene-11.10-mRNA-1 protein AED:1.00 eAED:1.00 QI:0/-1/0/0/-1/1/1/0/268